MGDIMYNFVMAAIVAELRKRLPAKGLLLTLPCVEGSSGLAPSAATIVTPQFPVHDSSYLDDECVMLCAQCPLQLTNDDSATFLELCTQSLSTSA